MTRRRRVLTKRRRKQNLALAGRSLSRQRPEKREMPGTRLTFAEDSAAIRDRWIPGDERDPPPEPDLQP
jgi:hypothetical protein